MLRISVTAQYAAQHKTEKSVEQTDFICKLSPVFQVFLAALNICLPFLEADKEISTLFRILHTLPWVFALLRASRKLLFWFVLPK